MRELEKKRKNKRLLYAPITLIVLIILVGFMIKAVFAAKEKARISQEHLVRAQTEAAELNGKYEAVKDEVTFLKTDQGVDAELRTKYRLVREGEGVAVIIDESATEIPKAQQKKGAWARFLEWLKK